LVSLFFGKGFYVFLGNCKRSGLIGTKKGERGGREGDLG